MILATLILAMAASPPTPTLCIAETCRQTAELRVAPADVARPFVWIARDGSRTVAGVITAGATAISLSDEKSQADKLTVMTSDASRPATQWGLRCGENRWNWSLAQLPKGVIGLQHPSGACELTLASDGYRSVATSTAATEIILRRLPVISGVITDSVTHIPIVGAQVLMPNGDSIATTDGAGQFRAAIDGEWPAWVKIDAVARARRTVLVPKAIADVHLPIAVSPGGTAVLTLDPSMADEELRYEARLIIDGNTEEKVRTGSIAVGERTITIEGLEPASYRFMILGDGPLQRIVVPVSISNGVTTETAVHIEPARLTLDVTNGGKPSPHAEVEVVFEGGLWRSKLATDEQGRAVEELWQRGDYLAAVTSWADSRRLDEDDITWKLDVPDRVIRGRVIEAGSNKPIANAVVVLEMHGSKTVERTGADGSYAFKNVPAEMYSLNVMRAGYEDLRTSPAAISDETHLEVRDLTLQTLTGRSLRALNAAGVPLQGAIVLVSSRKGTRIAGMASDDGRVTLPVASDETGAAFVLPSSGSFGATRFEAGDDELVVRVPDGTASLEVITQSTVGDPIGGVAFILRVNGILVPQVVKEAMSQHQGLPHASDATGRLLFARMPPGRYELWPLASREDLRAVASAAPPPAAVSVMLTPGHHVAKMVFKPRDQG